MNVRFIIAAVPLVLATACKTSSSQSQAGGSTQSASSDQGSADQQASQAPSGSQPGASGKVISGHVGHVSPYAVAIVSDQGDQTILQIVPQTTITVNGQDATYSQLEEGQPVHASFDEVDGQDVAVQIEVVPANMPPGPQGGEG